MTTCQAHNGPPVRAQLDDNIWHEIISTPSLFHGNAQSDSTDNKGILSHCTERDWFLHSPEQELL
jgi:hypothetical protein